MDLLFGMKSHLKQIDSTILETHGFYKVSSNDKFEWREATIVEYWELEL